MVFLLRDRSVVTPIHTEGTFLVWSYPFCRQCHPPVATCTFTTRLWH